MKLQELFEDINQSNPPTIVVNYEKWDMEDVDAGETDKIGHDHDAQYDQYDDEDYHGDVAKWAVAYITRKFGYVQPSNSHFSKGTWYTETDPDENYKTGEKTYHSIHLRNMTEDQEREVFQLLNKHHHN